jgi:hypothetical protein
MRIAKIALVLCLFLAASLSASGPVGVFAVIEKVVFEPNGTTAANAERVQVWGAFSWVDGGIRSTGRLHDIERGYMYFTLPKGTPAQIQAARSEWADLTSVAGTSQAVAFGQWHAPPQEGTGLLVMVDRPFAKGYALVVQKVAPPAWEPTLYVTNTGIVKLSAEGNHAAIVKTLRDALAAK